MMGEEKKTATTKGEVYAALRELRDEARRASHLIKASDLALDFYDNWSLGGDLPRLLTIDALTEMAREVIHNAGRKSRGGAGRSRSAGSRAAGEGETETLDEIEIEPELPDFAEICAACPENYALPDDRPADTTYADTFNTPCRRLPEGIAYLTKMARGSLRNATALQNLFDACQRVGFSGDETPRQVMTRHGYEPGGDC
jgi:hypothetical protein